MIKRFNICTKKIYTDKDGNEKNQWMRIGNLTHFPANGDKEEGYKLELYMHPATQFAIFEDKPRGNGEPEVNNETGKVVQPRANKKVEGTKPEYPQNNVDPADMPF